MKTNDAPKKIWINPTIDLPKLSGVMDKNSIEQIHKDTFIKKACEFMRNHIDPQLTIYHEQTWCKRDEFIEKCCKYMKGE